MPARAPVRLRIRGIYATALTRWALDAGFQVVQASAVIADRFSIPQLDLPADVTIKTSDEEPSELLAVGYTWAVEEVLTKLKELLPYSFYWVSRLPLHATVKAESLGGCRARVGDYEAEVAAEQCPPEGEQLVAGVVRPGVKPGETPRLVPGARVIGDYAIIYESPRPRVTISEHIRSTEKRAELAAVAARATSQGLSVHWRSSSRYAAREQLERHLEELIQRLQKVKEEAVAGPPGIYSEGETVALIRLSRPDKETLDEIRGKVVPTAPLHHSVKSVDPEASIAIDYAEKLLPRGINPEQLRDALLELYAERLAQARRIRLIHIKPDGTVIELGKAELRNIETRPGRLIITLERVVRSPGIYDGLGIEKEPGDRIVTTVDTSSWTIIHRYYSPSGTHKGTYININTPPELTSNSIIYLDLEADIVKVNVNNRVETRVIDVEKLDEVTKSGIVTEKMRNKINEIISQYANSTTRA